MEPAGVPEPLVMSDGRVLMAVLFGHCQPYRPMAPGQISSVSSQGILGEIGAVTDCERKAAGFAQPQDGLWRSVTAALRLPFPRVRPQGLRERN